MEEIVYELSAPLEGTGNGMIEDFILRCAVPAVIVLILGIAAVVLMRHRKWIRPVLLAMLLGGISLIVIPAVIFWNTVNLGEYLKNRTATSDFIEQNYVNPKNVKLSFPEQKRNLIFIYMESMESSFADETSGGGADVNYIPELTKLAQDNEDFSGKSDALNGGYSMPGTTWTIGGIFASTAGLPLMGSVDDNDMEQQESFFPNLVTLGDILEEQGYSQTFVCGSDVTFGGRRLYLTEHGNYDFLDWNYASETGLLPDGYKVFWGYEDAKLFSFAKDRATELASKEQPFNLTLLTVDTHMPDGFRCEVCGQEHGDFVYGNALSCSSRQVTSFVEWAQQQSWYDNTTIVLVGDHPTMATSMAAKINPDITRKTYACYINSAVSPENPDVTRTYTTFDTFPTTIAALGAEIPGNRLGLGTNLYSSLQTVSEICGYDEEKSELSKHSDALDELEAPDEATQNLIRKYELIQPEISTDPEEYLLEFRSPDMSRDEAVKGVRIRLWYYANEQYVHHWVDGVLQDDGTYLISHTNATFFQTNELHYQMLAQTDNGSVNLGMEGVIDPNNYDRYGLRNPVRKYAEQLENTMPPAEAIERKFLVERETDGAQNAQSETESAAE